MLFKSILLAAFSVTILLSSLDLTESYGPLKFVDNFSGDLRQWNLVDGDGNGGFGNYELQYERPDNARTQNGNLIITSKKEWYNNHKYTSARLISKQAFRYGYFEMRAKLPRGNGTWPAFWLLAAKDPLNWPRDGEIDIMEHVGSDPGVIHGTVHCEKYSVEKKNLKSATRKIVDPFDTFHVYGLEWSSNSIKVFVDGFLYFQYNKEDNSYESWPFDNQFNIIVNNAIGGTLGGKVDDLIFPTQYTIDYVRVYELYRRVTLRSKYNNQYVSAENAGYSPLVANRAQAQLWETFELINNADGTVSFRSLANNRFVCAEDNGNSPLIANRNAIDDWEKFRIITNNDGTVSFRANANGKIVSADFSDGGKLIANRVAIDTWESFYLTYV